MDDEGEKKSNSNYFFGVPIPWNGFKSISTRDSLLFDHDMELHDLHQQRLCPFLVQLVDEFLETFTERTKVQANRHKKRQVRMVDEKIHFGHRQNVDAREQPAEKVRLVPRNAESEQFPFWNSGFRWWKVNTYRATYIHIYGL